MSIQNDPGSQLPQLNLRNQSIQQAQNQGFDTAVRNTQGAQQVTNNQAHLSTQTNAPVDQVRNQQVETLQNRDMNRIDSHRVQQMQQDQLNIGRQSVNTQQLQVPNIQTMKTPALDPTQITNFLKRILQAGSGLLSGLRRRIVPRTREGEVGYETGEHLEESRTRKEPSD